MFPICHVNLASGYRGGERQTELLIRALAREGVAQRLVVRAGQPLAERLCGLDSLEIQEIGKPFFRHALRLRGFLLHAHDGHGAKFACLASLTSGTRYVVTRRIGKRPSSNPWTRAVYARASAIVAVAESVARTMRAYVPGQRIEVIHSALGRLGVDQASRGAIRNRWPDAFLIVNVAALVQSQKGQLHLLRVARRLRAERPDIQFVLLGEGRDRTWLESQARDLDNVAFEGFVGNVGDYLAAADAFVLPSLHEGIGGACLDAMYAGLPVVASAVDGVPEIVQDGVNGLLVPAADEGALFEAICRLRDDAALAQRLAEQGRKMAEAYLPERMATRYLDLYRSIADSDGS